MKTRATPIDEHDIEMPVAIQIRDADAGRGLALFSSSTERWNDGTAAAPAKRVVVTMRVAPIIPQKPRRCIRETKAVRPPEETRYSSAAGRRSRGFGAGRMAANGTASMVHSCPLVAVSLSRPPIRSSVCGWLRPWLLPRRPAWRARRRGQRVSSNRRDSTAQSRHRSVSSSGRALLRR